jgi:hypothetical protein
MDEMVEYYGEDTTKLSNELLWMGILLQRSEIVSIEDKERIAARLKMYDYLFENDPKIKKIRAESEAKGRVEGEARGDLKRARQAVITIVKGRFPALVELARERTSCINQSDALDNLLLKVGTAPNEEMVRVLLETTQSKEGRSLQG